jgi:hypothetical protein
LKPAPHLLCGPHAKLVEGVLKKLVAAQLQAQAKAPRTLPTTTRLELREEEPPFILEAQGAAQLGAADQGLQGRIEN